jgi:hypothetical protein
MGTKLSERAATRKRVEAETGSGQATGRETRGTEIAVCGESALAQRVMNDFQSTRAPGCALVIDVGGDARSRQFSPETGRETRDYFFQKSENFLDTILENVKSSQHVTLLYAT